MYTNIVDFQDTIGEFILRIEWCLENCKSDFYADFPGIREGASEMWRDEFESGFFMDKTITFRTYYGADLKYFKFEFQDADEAMRFKLSFD